ncbi:MAG: fumarylacetoacetate hydrolase family protein [Planctomycetota bacterium]|jgi:2-keto-4-pentenoate hydratase/2-oxohepta-3-ene-1,7-dioic acid hydratase in catechol pathway
MKHPPAIFGIGRNYADHAVEMGGAAPSRPVVFMKNPASVIADGDAIVIPSACGEGGEQVDFEGELAVILGRDCRDADPAAARAAIGAYAAANDVSARWWQREGAGGQFVRGKSFDTFCPLSIPRPADAVGDPGALRVVTTVNGEVMQDATTDRMLFPVDRLVAELSRDLTLLAGTVILTGTPAGVGAARTPPRFLRDGDVVEVRIDGVGRVRNPVRACGPGVAQAGTSSAT